jgi:hypothetical protein
MRLACLTLVAAVLILGSGDVYADKLSKATFNTWSKDVKDALKDDNAKKAIELIGKLAADDSERLAKFLFSISSKYYTPEIIEDIKQALGKISDHDGVRYVVTNATRAKTGLRPALAQVLGSMSNKDAFNVLLKYLDSRDAATVKEAAKAIARKRDSNVVSKLIKSLEYWEDRDKKVVAELRYALTYCTGASSSEGLDKAEDWRNFWRKKSSESDSSGSGRTATANPKTPDFFGTALSSMRFVFIIDISGSMNIVDPGEGDTSGDASGGTAPSEEVEKERAAGQTRIARTKAELIKAIKQISKDVKFNIITFCHDIKSWKSSLQEANAANKQAAIEFVKGLTASGLTYTDDALREAFKNKDADTFLLLSDGAPTHEGGEAREEWGGHRDSKEVIERIHKEVTELNRLRNVRINTIGFKDANVEFMKKLAKDNGGSCTELK